MRVDRIWINARLMTLDPARPGLGVVERGLVAAAGGRIVYAGAAVDAPALAADAAEDCGGRWISPGLIDCHTHLVHAGDRAREFEQRLEGATYEMIARAGGGILASIQAVRAAGEAELVAASLPRLDALMAEGVTTIEVKSGYGATLADEMKLLRAGRALARLRDVEVATTLLGLHALPPSWDGDAEGYVDHVCAAVLPAVAAAGLADAADAFCERIAFSSDQVGRYFSAARRFGLPVKLHADQLSDGGGAALAARFGALSADHLEYAGEAGAAAMAAAGTVAVLLPGAFYVLREERVPPVGALRRHGVPIALATDCNPGTSPLTSLLLAMNMGATLFRLTVAECIAGVTREAARALGRLDRCGTLRPGMWCDLAIWNIGQPAELVCRMGFNPLHQRIWRGR